MSDAMNTPIHQLSGKTFLNQTSAKIMQKIIVKMP